jgi:hypothetical protein
MGLAAHTMGLVAQTIGLAALLEDGLVLELVLYHLKFEDSWTLKKNFCFL